jgi:copper oxidase (laccase) domain-containing protein
VVLFDKKKGLVALVHLGWRGVDLRLAEKVVQELIRLGSESSNIYATIGPGVRKGSYMKWGVGWKEFVEEVDMGEWGMFVEDVGEKRTIDLVGFVESQLKSVGVEKIDVSGTDTVSDMRYFSHHRSYLTGEPEGRFATVAIML